jgi:tRNA A22 N-methylase
MAVARLIGHTDRLADIGCDHGKLCVYCLLTGIADSAVAVDISAPSLDKARRLAEHYDVALDAYVGDGLRPLDPSMVHTAVIAGMGGMEIARILASAPFCPPRLVLLPHKNADVVVRYLYLAGYRVTADYVLSEDSHWYRAIAAEAQSAVALGADWQFAVAATDDGLNWYVGKDNATNPAYADYRRSRLNKLLSYVEAGNRDGKVLAEIKYLQQTE